MLTQTESPKNSVGFLIPSQNLVYLLPFHSLDIRGNLPYLSWFCNQTGWFHSLIQVSLYHASQSEDCHFASVTLTLSRYHVSFHTFENLIYWWLQHNCAEYHWTMMHLLCKKSSWVSIRRRRHFFLFRLKTGFNPFIHRRRTIRRGLFYSVRVIY